MSNALGFFYGVSGHKINFQKSSIIGVGVCQEEIGRLAYFIGCKAQNLPFKYLGIPIGGSAKRVSFWEPVFNKFKKHFSGWKAILFSIGGTLTLIKSVLGSLGNYFLSIYRMPKSVVKTLESLRCSVFWGGSLNIRKIHWINWNTALASKKVGGLGIGSLNVLNFSLLYKWRWRGINYRDSLWAQVILDIHGKECFYNMSAKSNGNWNNIVAANKHVHTMGIRSGSVQEQLHSMVGLLPRDLDNSDDRWRISMINHFVWRLLRNGIPTNVNLFGKGVDISTVRCNLCDSGIDDTSHLFRHCPFTCDPRSKINPWVHHNIPDEDPKDKLNWYKGLHLTNFQRQVLEAIMLMWWWHIWKERNNGFHNGHHTSVDDTFTSIVSLSFLWVSNRDWSILLIGMNGK
uniref:uncharacterized protein LOC122591616 n=1 Tax=Erigeron canadensis TaxID=72917 RepID=UPI001CB9975B|nr:uncharacterized protein LOC122591616 [Erigeron canadensis]